MKIKGILSQFCFSVEATAIPAAERPETLVRLVKFLTGQGLVLPLYKQPQGVGMAEVAGGSERITRRVTTCQARERDFPPWESLVLPHEMDGGGHRFGVSDASRLPYPEVLPWAT